MRKGSISFSSQLMLLVRNVSLASSSLRHVFSLSLFSLNIFKYSLSLLGDSYQQAHKESSIFNFLFLLHRRLTRCSKFYLSSYFSRSVSESLTASINSFLLFPIRNFIFCRYWLCLIYYFIIACYFEVKSQFLMASYTDDFELFIYQSFLSGIILLQCWERAIKQSIIFCLLFFLDNSIFFTFLLTSNGSGTGLMMTYGMTRYSLISISIYLFCLRGGSLTQLFSLILGKVKGDFYSQLTITSDRCKGYSFYRINLIMRLFSSSAPSFLYSLISWFSIFMAVFLL